MARGERRQYDYQPPSFEETVDRADRKGSMFDSMFKDVKVFKAEQGANLVRILPPGWEGARHYGYRIKVQRNVGPKDRQYLCLRENEASPYKKCPICLELYKLGSRATQQDKQLLTAGDSVVYYIVARNSP